MATHRADDDPMGSKDRKACMNCRRQKMKCKLDDDTTCRRCRRTGLPCIFVPRANAATNPPLPPLISRPQETSNSILQRLGYIENLLGIRTPHVSADVENPRISGGSGISNSPSGGLEDSLQIAVAKLREVAPKDVSDIIWHDETIHELWSRFHERMPGLHFMPSRHVFASPCPLLLICMLYCSSIRGSDETADLAPQYFAVLGHAFSQLSIPNSELGRVPQETRQAEKWAFQSILAIVLAGLLCEGRTPETGIWISIAYRLILEHCPPGIEEQSKDWRKLFCGVQIVDLEHASLHLSCPAIPTTAPLQALQTPARDQLSRLSRIMHAGLTHFTGRGLPTIWSCFIDVPTRSNSSSLDFTPTDAAVIRDWARQLDDWLLEFSRSTEDSPENCILVFRQYILHRLTVLSIYHPARGSDIGSQSILPVEQYELMLSARAALRLQLNDRKIWSNWDLVIISRAALIVLQGLEGGLGEPTDLELVNKHLTALREIHEPASGLRGILITRLEHHINRIHAQDASTQAHVSYTPGTTTTVDSSWQIFDQSSLEQMHMLI